MYTRVENFISQINWLISSIVGFLLGVLVASFFIVPEIIISLTPFAALVFRKNRYVRMLALMLLFFVAGFLYFNSQDYIPADSREYYEQQEELQILSGLKTKLSQGLDKTLLPPHSSLYKAMILGDKSGISYDMRQNLSRAGLSHIVAVSGMHIAILGLVIFFVLVKFFRRPYAAFVSFSILTFYILMIGAPASAVRAGIMAAVIVLAQLVGRPNSTLRALLYAATAMVIVNPIIIRYDIGFQLSFLAVLGILLFYKRLDSFFKRTQYKFIEFVTGSPITKDRNIATYLAEGRFGLTTLLAITFCAQAFTFPLVLYYFDVFSFVSPITNILVVPILPLVLIFGFISAIAGALNFLPIIFAAPAWLFSSYIVWIIEIFT